MYYIYIRSDQFLIQVESYVFEPYIAPVSDGSHRYGARAPSILILDSFSAMRVR